MRLILAFIFFIPLYINAQQFYKQTDASQHWVDSVFNSLTPQQRIAQLMVVRESEYHLAGMLFFILIK